MSALSKLKWHCRRGVKELDIVLMYYLDHHYQNTSEPEQKAFEELLENEDPILLALLMKDTKADNAIQNNLLDKLRTMNQFQNK